MYIPKHFKADDEQEAITFMQKYSFATLVTATDNLPEATNLPFLVSTVGDKVILSSHLAKVNQQAAILINSKPLVIFSEPHAYISPSNYEKEQNVPTWNYIAIHAYGVVTVVDDADEKLAVLDKMVSFYDKAYAQQWVSLPMDYKLKMLNGIVAFDITVTDLQVKHKLSQNRSEQERSNIIDSLSKSPSASEREIAEYMRHQQ